MDEAKSLPDTPSTGPLDQYNMHYDVACAPTLDDWLEEFQPSKVEREKDNALGIISIYAQDVEPGKDLASASTDVPSLQKSFQELVATGHQITHNAIAELAKRHHVLGGNWMLPVRSGFKADVLWKIVAKETWAGNLGSAAYIRIGTSPFQNDNMQIIYMKVQDYTDEQQVMAVEAGIRAAGIRSSLNFKPTAHSNLGLFSKNRFGLPPSLYRSVYDIHQGCSVVTTTT